MALVSVIIPSYNTAHLIGAAIQSVLDQSYRDLEAIVVDDGSTDNTREVVAAINDSRVCYLYQSNLGLAGARNTGLAQAQGEYVAFLDSDDLFLPNKLEWQVQALESQPNLGLIAGGYRFIDETGQVLANRRPWLRQSQIDLRAAMVGLPFVVHAVLVRREWLTRVGGFDRTLRRAEDRDLWMRLAFHGCPMAWDPHLVCSYRVHSGQMVKNGHSQKEITLSVVDKFFTRPDLSPDLQKIRAEVYGNVYLEGAFREYGSNEIGFAKESLTKAMAAMPALMDGEGEDLPFLAYVLVGWAINPITDAPTQFVKRVLDNLPDSAAGLRPFRQHICYMAVIGAAIDALVVGNRAQARQYLNDALQAGNSLGDNPALVYELLVDWISDETEDRQLECLEAFFDILPDALSNLLPLRHKALGRLHMSRGFSGYATGETRQAAREMWQGIRHDPAWLRDRGVWSIMVRSWLGLARN